jgi:ABC-type lipoprotein export system ATPase subunit
VTAVVGRSGSGKTTLLHLIAGLELPNAGLVEVAGTPLGELNRSERAALRRRGIALVTQEPGLVPYLSALENVELGLTLRGTAGADAREALAVVGLAERVDQQVARLSAGERQRVAIARALAADVNLILLDEPTARLDEANARSVAALLLRLANERSTTILCATHDPLLIDLAADVLRLDGGGSPALAG